jgi:hypothetical protein
MSANVPLSIRIGAIFDNKGLKQADKGVKKLQLSVKNLAGAVGIAFSARALVNFSKSAVRASLQQQAEQDRLNQLLTVGVGATASQVAALNDQANALEKLGVVTAGNITQTQSQLATFNLQTSTIEKLTPAILDYVTAEKGATASTEQFKQMTNGLAQALNGNFASLTRVGFVIDENTKKQIKSGNESERAQAIVDVLNSTYKDFNKNLRETPAGQMQVLANAAEDAQTIIGTGLIDSLMILSGDTSVEDLANTMQKVATNTSTAITEIAKLGRAVGTFFSGGYSKIDKFSDDITDLIDRLTFNSDRIGRRNVGQAGRLFGGGSGGTGGNIETPQERAQRIKRENEQKRLAASLLAAENKRLKSEKARAALAKAQLALGKASQTLDLERIGIEAALKGSISETDRLSLLLQKSILNENATLATQLADQLEAAIKRQNDIRSLLLTTPEAPNPYRNWKFPEVPQDLINYTAASLGVSPETVINAPQTIPAQTTDATQELLAALLAAEAAQRASDVALATASSVGVASNIPPISIVVELDGSVVGGAITEVQTNQSLSGSFVNVNRLGRFANTPIAI